MKWGAGCRGRTLSYKNEIGNYHHDDDGGVCLCVCVGQWSYVLPEVIENIKSLITG